VEAKREFQTTLVVESKRLASTINNVFVEVENLDEKVKKTKVKLVSAIVDLGKMEQKPSSTKEHEHNAFKVEITINLNLQRMKIDVEDAKVATKNILNKSINLRHIVVDSLFFVS
jgi:hypothetical protein